MDLMDSSRTILNRLLRKRSDPHLSSKGGHLSTGWERNSDLSASVSTGQQSRTFARFLIEGELFGAINYLKNRVKRKRIRVRQNR